MHAARQRTHNGVLAFGVLLFASTVYIVSSFKRYPAKVFLENFFFRPTRATSSTSTIHHQTPTNKSANSDEAAMTFQLQLLEDENDTIQFKHFYMFTIHPLCFKPLWLTNLDTIGSLVLFDWQI